jgi:hypothetical protein
VVAEKQEHHRGKRNGELAGSLLSREPKQDDSHQQDLDAQGQGQEHRGDDLLENKHFVASVGLLGG